MSPTSAEDPASTAIATRDLKKTYPGGVTALDGLTFSVQRGAIFALLGPNGAGKSTTIKILTTLSQPDSGAANVAGFDVLREPRKVRQSIGCVAQRSGVDLDSTGRENLTLQGQLYGLRGEPLKVRVNELLDRFRLTKSADLVARTYSGGMQRKLDIATGLIHRPQVLFLDEPTTGLDPEARSDLWSEIERLSSEGLTILLTTHYMDEADRLAERMAIVDRGRVVVEGSPEQLKAELRGDSVQIDFADLESGASPDEGNIQRVLERVNGLREIAVDGICLHARAEHGATAVPLMITALESAGARVASVKVSRPSLDDVYLRYTGRTFEQAEGEKR